MHSLHKQTEINQYGSIRDISATTIRKNVYRATCLKFDITVVFGGGGGGIRTRYNLVIFYQIALKVSWNFLEGLTVKKISLYKNRFF